MGVFVVLSGSGTLRGPSGPLKQLHGRQQKITEHFGCASSFWSDLLLIFFHVELVFIGLLHYPIRCLLGIATRSLGLA